MIFRKKNHCVLDISAVQEVAGRCRNRWPVGQSHLVWFLILDAFVLLRKTETLFTSQKYGWGFLHASNKKNTHTIYFIVSAMAQKTEYLPEIASRSRMFSNETRVTHKVPRKRLRSGVSCSQKAYIHWCLILGDLQITSEGLKAMHPLTSALILPQCGLTHLFAFWFAMWFVHKSIQNGPSGVYDWFYSIPKIYQSSLTESSMLW